MSDEMVLVPKRPTDDMVKHGLMPAPIRVSKADVREIYAAMIEAFDRIAWEAARNQVIQELIEKAKADFLDAQKRREEMSGTSLSLRVDRAKATYEWLKSQMEGE